MPTFVPSSIGGNLCPFGHDVRVCKHPGLSAHLPLRNFVGQKYPFQPLRRSESSSLQVSSPTASADVKTSKQSIDSLTSSILSDPDIEGDPIKFLRVSEAYWQACPPCDILVFMLLLLVLPSCTHRCSLTCTCAHYFVIHLEFCKNLGFSSGACRL